MEGGRKGAMAQRSDRGLKRERMMEVGCRLTFSTTACQINGMSV